MTSYADISFSLLGDGKATSVTLDLTKDCQSVTLFPTPTGVEALSGVTSVSLSGSQITLTFATPPPVNEMINPTIRLHMD